MNWNYLFCCLNEWLIKQAKRFWNLFVAIVVMMLIYCFSIIYLNHPLFFIDFLKSVINSVVNRSIILPELDHSHLSSSKLAFSDFNLFHLTFFVLVTFVILSLVYYRNDVGKLMNRIKRFGWNGNIIEFEPGPGENKHDDNSEGTAGIIRDTFLLQGNYLFKDKGEYSEAIHQYILANRMKKSVLSSYMILSCCLKLENINIESLVSVYNDALIVAEKSKYQREDLNEIRFKLRRFILEGKKKRDVLDSKAFVLDLKKSQEKFEREIWPWMRSKNLPQDERKHSA